MTIEFSAIGDFKALADATAFATQKGYSVGSLCGKEPVALIRGKDVLVAKWRNLTGREKGFVDGLITSTDFRNGPVTVKLLRE